MAAGQGAVLSIISVIFSPLEILMRRRTHSPIGSRSQDHQGDSLMGFQNLAFQACDGRVARPRAAIAPRAGRMWTTALRAAVSCAVIGLSALTMGCAQSAEGFAQAAPEPVAAAPDPGRTVGDPQVGTASYYARRFTGRRMASGGRFDPASDTIAHRTLPFGTVVRVTNLQNGLSVTGTVLDRGPWTRGRIVDLSPRIARNLDMIRSGIAQVEVVPVELAEAPE